MPIIINSRSCSDAGWWTNHLKKAETNERVEVIGFYGLSAETIEDAFSEMQAMARASKRTTNFFSQYNINPRADERLTEAQWEEAHALHRKNHGLDHLPYFRVRHVKEGRVHEHGIALRVDPETGKAISDSLTAADNERTSRALEIRFDLERGRSILTRDREGERPERRPKKRETFREGRKIDLETVNADARAAREQADNGRSFRAAIEASGDYVLARGDRRDFVIVDRNGEAHSLAKRLGMKTAEMRGYTADLDPASMPSVEQAKALQAERQTDRAEQSRPLTRMYRGIGDNVAASQPGDALYFSTDPARAAAFGTVHYVDVTVAEMARFERPHSERFHQFESVAKNDWITADPAIIARLRPLEVERQEGRETAQEARQSPAPQTVRETWSAAARSLDEPPPPPKPAPEAKPARVLRGTAADIRTAWRDSDDLNPETDSAKLAAAFAARGISLAQVTPEEAYASERRTALAKAAGNFVPAWREGEIVAVDRHGAAYRLNERVTGDSHAVIEGRLAWLDSATLPSVAAAKDVARATGRAAIEKKRAERADAPINQTAGEMRLAWNLSRHADAAQLSEALEDRGLRLARATAAEAEASVDQAELRRQRMLQNDASALGRYATMKAPEPGRYAPEIDAGEIVAVDQRGGVYRFDAGTTGTMRPEIEARLSEIDSATLPNVTDAKAAMIEESRAAWIAEREAEREKARPASALEGRIIECAEQARLFGAHVYKDDQGNILSGAAALADRLRAEEDRNSEGAIVRGLPAFAARLDEAGIALVRVTAADVLALDALRQGEALERLSAETNVEARKQHHFAKLAEGELAAVTRGGDVHRINPAKMPGVELPADLPGVILARDRFATERQDKTTIWELKRAEIDAERRKWEGDRQLGRAASTAESAVHTAFETPAAAVGKTVRKTGKLAQVATRTIETAFGLLFGAFMAGPKDTRPQAEQKAKAATNEETLHAEAVTAEAAENAAKLNNLLGQIARDDDIAKAERYNRTGGAGSYDRPAELGDDYGRERERD